MENPHIRGHHIPWLQQVAGVYKETTSLGIQGAQAHQDTSIAVHDYLWRYVWGLHDYSTQNPEESEEIRDIIGDDDVQFRSIARSFATALLGVFFSDGTEIVINSKPDYICGACVTGNHCKEVEVSDFDEGHIGTLRYQLEKLDLPYRISEDGSLMVNPQDLRAVLIYNSKQSGLDESDGLI